MSTYIVKITGTFPIIVNWGNPNITKLVSIESWGNIAWKTMNNAFAGCSNLEFCNATDSPDLSNVEDMSYMFYYSPKFNADLSNWNTSTVQCMDRMFEYAINFNQDLRSWVVSSVTAHNNFATNWGGGTQPTWH